MDTFADDDAIRCLRYVATLAASGHPLNTSQLDAFNEARVPTRQRGIGAFTAWMGSESVDGHMSHYLDSVGWAHISRDAYRTMTVTRLGSAVLEAHSTVEIAPARDSFELIIRPEEPLNYATLFDHVATMTDATFVDCYLPTATLKYFVDLVAVKRILVGREKVGSQRWADRKASFARSLGAEPRLPEIKHVKGARLHDRLVIPSHGRGLLLGGSLDGRQPNTVVQMSEAMTRQQRDALKSTWADAESIEPASSPDAATA